MLVFPPFRLDLADERLWRDGQELRLRRKPFAILRYLVEHPQRLVTQEELVEAVWGKIAMSESLLRTHVHDLRQALGEGIIETVVGRGYRFVQEVQYLDEPVVARTRLPEAESALAGASLIVGREEALDVLHASLRQALEGKRQLVFVTGDAGIGKTTLVDTIVVRALHESAAWVARGSCVEHYGSGEPYLPVLAALGTVCRLPSGQRVTEVLRQHAPTWLMQMPGLVTDQDLEGLQRRVQGATQARMLRELAEALDVLSAEQPVLLVLEDLQWSDPSTTELLALLGRRREAARLLIVGTCRRTGVAKTDPLAKVMGELVAHEEAKLLPLDGLPEVAVTEYLALRFPGHTFPGDLANRIHRGTGGNPLFMVALIADLERREMVRRIRGRWELCATVEEVSARRPDTVRRLIDIQIDRLSTTQQRVLEAAGVAGAVFSAAVVAHALDLEADAVDSCCEVLATEHHFLRYLGTEPWPDGTLQSRYGFIHALYQDAALARNPSASIRLWHRRMGERLEAGYAHGTDLIAAELAHHFEEASDWSRAIQYLRLAAETAGRRYALPEATAVLQHALSLLRKLPETERGVIETEILAKLAAIYVVSFDERAVETYETLVERAARYGLLDVEVRALLDMVYPLSFISSERCIEVAQRALRLSARQDDPLLRATTRATCFLRRMQVSGWNPRGAEECRNALAEIRKAGDRVVLAQYLIEYSIVQWVSSEYREAHRSAVEGLAILSQESAESLDLSISYWHTQFIVPSSLLYMGEWGEALRETKAQIAMTEKNGAPYRAQTLRLNQACVHLHAMDFAGALAICDSILPLCGGPAAKPWRLRCLVFAGLAETALGNYDHALEHLLAARDEMDRQTVMSEWIWRMWLEAGFTELWLAKGDLGQAGPQAERFLDATLATAERTCQALAWEANARVAAAATDLKRAKDCISKALLTMEGFEVPLASWRVHATAADLYEHTGQRKVARHQRKLSRTVILRLAESLAGEETLRSTFLSAASVFKILGKESGSI